MSKRARRMPRLKTLWGLPAAYRFGFVVLGPLLWVQGRYVRRVTPQLDEASGERGGKLQRAKHQAELSVLIVGDSAAAGVGVDHQSDALAGHLTAELSKTHNVNWKLVAKSGETSRQLIDTLQATEKSQFDIAVVSIGVNDVISLTRSKEWTQNILSLVQCLNTQFHVRQVYLSSLPPMHLFPALLHPLKWWLGVRARHFNHLMQDVAANCPHCDFVTIPYELDPSAIATDGFHPGPGAYRIWGRHIATTILNDRILSL